MSTAASTGSPASTGASTGAAASSGGFTWGDGWRQNLIAGSTFDPEQENKRLERYESPGQIYRSYRELESRVSSGEYKRQLPKGATAEETAKWRQENGIPAKAEDYKITMPAGKEPPKDDDGFLNAFRKSAFDSNYTQAQFDHAVQTFYAEVDRTLQATSENDKLAEAKMQETLRNEWGGDYKVNMAMAEGLLSRAPAGFRDRFMNARLDDGQLIKADPEAWKWLVQLEREINPTATVVPGYGADAGKNLEAEIADIEKFMRENRAAYNKDEAKQKRLRDLYAARDSQKKRA